jgi:hypothetical protein
MKRWLVAIAIGVAVIAAGAISWALDRDAKSAGFHSVFERYAAAHAGYTDPQAYRAFRESEERRKADTVRMNREREEAINAGAASKPGFVEFGLRAKQR